MAVSKVSFGVFVIIALICAATMVPIASAQSPAPAPAPSNNSSAIDQGIAYGLMLAALLLTYLIH